MRWIKKAFFDGLDELNHHAKYGKDLQREPAVGAKMFCVFSL